LYYGQWSLIVRNGHFQHLAEQKPLDRSKQTFLKLINSLGPQNRLKFIIRGTGVVTYDAGEIACCRSFSGVLLGKCTAVDPSARAPHAIQQSTRFRPSICVWGLIDTFHPTGSYPPKTLHFWDINGDFQLERLRANSAQEKRIITLDGSNYASR
jgi:hypothetical protein